MSGEDAVSTVRAALERTRAAGTARIVHETRSDVPDGRKLEGPVPPEELPEPMHSMMQFARKAVEAMSSMRALRPEGHIDFARRRCVYAAGPFTSVVDGDAAWAGAVAHLENAPGEVAAQWGNPVAMLALLQGVHTASEVEDASSDLARFDTECDLLDAAATSGLDLPVPSPVRVSDLSRLPVEVWIDRDGHVRRLECGIGMARGKITSVLELSDFGCELPDGWDRLPRRAG